MKCGEGGRGGERVGVGGFVWEWCGWFTLGEREVKRNGKGFPSKFALFLPTSAPQLPVFQPWNPLDSSGIQWIPLESSGFQGWKTGS